MFTSSDEVREYCRRIIDTPADFLGLSSRMILQRCGYHPIPDDEVIRWLKLVDAYWKFDYQGDPTRPHALLTAGGHSDGFVNCLALLSYPGASELCASILVNKLQALPDLYLDEVDLVVGSPYVGITFSYDVASLILAKHGFTEKSDDGKGKVWKRDQIHPLMRVLLIEELITTMKTAQEQREALKTTTGEPVNFVPVLGVFFNRSGETTFDDWPIVSVVEQKITNWTPEECPLCKAGSEAIRPKQNWARLTGQA